MTLVYQDGFARPPDVDEYVPFPVTYAPRGSPNIIGDGTGTRGSPMPILATQLDDIPSTALGWLVPGDAPPETTDLDHGEAKFRAHANVSHILPDDPIRSYGQPGASHLHTFFGNVTANAHSTFATLRNRANELAALSRCATTTSGGPYNGSAYWIPAMMNGDHVVKPGMIFIYYTSNPASRSLKAQRLPRGLRYVTGCNMDDPDDLIVKAQIDAANAQTGTAGRYGYAGNGFGGWAMLSEDTNTLIPTGTGEQTSPYFVNPDGSNPWPDAPSVGYLKPFINAPIGYDGRNLWSPGGYQHTYHGVLDFDTGSIVIPQGAFYIPELQIVPFYRHNGWTDYQNWRLSSDDHAGMVAGREFASGESMHADWFGAWDDSAFGADTGWQIQCVGVKDGVTMHECGSGCIRADGTRLLGSIAGDNAPDGSRSPQVGLPEVYDTANLADMFAVPDAFAGPITVPARAA